MKSIALFVFASVWCLVALQAEVTVERVSDDRVRVEIDGELFTEYLMHGYSNPILYPIINASGQGMTRDWPIRKDGRAGEARDHPHHKSLFVGHQGINGTDFWHEGREGCGTIEHAEVLEHSDGDEGVLRVANHWRDAQGRELLSEQRDMRFGERGGVRYIDITLILTAKDGEVAFEAYKDGFAAIRMHADLSLTPWEKHGILEVYGHAENSEGVTDREIWGKRAKWIHYWGKVEGKDAGVAILSHSQNIREPAWWHARHYGLAAVNPFALIKDGGDGDYTLKTGQTLKLRYRFLFHDEVKSAVDMESQYAAFVAASP